ncbi:MAG: GTPase domain-containing protein [Candidatus Aminicenantales bacterium]
MSFINHVTRQVAIKIVYYGPGLSGKTTNLRFIYFKLDPSSRGDLVCLETDTERTYFFDLLPVKAGLIGDYKVHFQLMTVPGQIFCEASRKNVLRGADGIVFVADSQIPLLDANLESFDNLRRNLLSLEVDINSTPLVFQYNKRDLDDLIPVETFNQLLNPQSLPYVEASAINGIGVFETLKEVAKLTVPAVKEEVLGVADGEEEKAAAGNSAQEAVREATQKEEEVEFVSPEEEADTQMRKMKLRTLDEVERELERLSREFLEKPKKTQSS